MRILLICAGGFSTSILMNKLKEYASNTHEDIQAEAHAITEFEEYQNNFDVVLLGPQISYQVEELREKTDLPIGVIPSLDYAMGNAKAIIETAKNLTKT